MAASASNGLGKSFRPPAWSWGALLIGWLSLTVVAERYGYFAREEIFTRLPFVCFGILVLSLAAAIGVFFISRRSNTAGGIALSAVAVVGALAGVFLLPALFPSVPEEAPRALAEKPDDGSWRRDMVGDLRSMTVIKEVAADIQGAANRVDAATKAFSDAGGVEARAIVDLASIEQRLAQVDEWAAATRALATVLRESGDRLEKRLRDALVAEDKAKEKRVEFVRANNVTAHLQVCECEDALTIQFHNMLQLLKDNAGRWSVAEDKLQWNADMSRQEYERFVAIMERVRKADECRRAAIARVRKPQGG